MPLTYKLAKQIVNDFDFDFVGQNWSHQKYLKNWKHVILVFGKEFFVWTAKNIIEQIADATHLPVEYFVKKYQIKF